MCDLVGRFSSYLTFIERKNMLLLSTFYFFTAAASIYAAQFHYHLVTLRLCGVALFIRIT